MISWKHFTFIYIENVRHHLVRGAPLGAFSSYGTFVFCQNWKTVISKAFLHMAIDGLPREIVTWWTHYVVDLIYPKYSFCQEVEVKRICHFPMFWGHMVFIQFEVIFNFIHHTCYFHPNNISTILILSQQLIASNQFLELCWSHVRCCTYHKPNVNFVGLLKHV